MASPISAGSNRLLTAYELRELAGEAGICVSICMPTHRTGAQELHDPIRLRSLLRSARSQLRGLGLEAAMVQQILDPAASLLDDQGFWEHPSGGLAVFCAPGFFRLFRTPLSLPELAVVAARFHLKPLLSLLTGNVRFCILALNRDRPRLFLAAGDQISELDLPPDQKPAGDERLAARFRRVDQGVRDTLAGGSDPLILAGAESESSLYRKANSYPHLLHTALDRSVDDMAPRELLEQVLPIALDHFSQAEECVAGRYRHLVYNGLASSDLRTVLEAASCGRVQSLLVPVGVQIWGSYRPEERELVIRDEPAAETEDLLTLAAVQTLVHAGEVYAVQPDRVPDGGPLAATFRY